MHKAVKETIVATWAGWSEYNIRDKLTNVIYPDIIGSNSVKKQYDSYRRPIFTEREEQLSTDVTQDINIHFLETMFEQMPVDVTHLMDITPLVDELCVYTVAHSTSFGRDSGKTTIEYKKTGNIAGSLIIKYDWIKNDEFGMIETDDNETHVIPGVIYQNHKYYAITNPFIDWLRTPDKPKRQAFLNELFYQ